MNSRRAFVASTIAAAGSTLYRARATAAPLPRLGVVASAQVPGGPDQALATVRELGLPTCQLHVGLAPAELAIPIRSAMAKHNIDITALMTLGSGRMEWNLRNGPETIGVIPRATRAARIDALKRASDLAKLCGVAAVHTHCGFIPERPDDPLYAEALKAIGDVARYCRGNHQMFLCETGQETPITLLRVIQDLAMDNIAVNLDLANLILYGKGEPLGALDVLGRHVRGIHAKDGMYPKDPYGLGEEVSIGSGQVRFPEVIHKLRELSYSGPITIEREISGPRQQADIRSSKRYLEQLIQHEYGG